MLLGLGIGFTNLCSRPTRRADELTREEIRAGALALREKLEQFRGLYMDDAFPRPALLELSAVSVIVPTLPFATTLRSRPAQPL